MVADIPTSGFQPGFVQFLFCTAIALAACLPIGAVSILTIQRALAYGSWRAFWPTLGAVAGNGIFGIIAALGAGYLTTVIMGETFWLRLAGSVLLVIIGYRLYAHAHTKEDVRRERNDHFQLALLYLMLVLSNPLTLGFYLAAFAMLGLKSDHLFALQSFRMGSGIAFGSTIWFLAICIAAGRFHMRIGDTLTGRIRKGVGILLMLLALVSAVSALVKG